MDQEDDEPVTPAGRFFLQPDMQQVINCVVGLKFPIDIEATKAEIRNTLLKHPRFCSILVKDNHGIERWRRTHVDIDQHIFFLTQFQGDTDEVGDGESVNRYLADLAVSSPLDLTKPPWEIHVLQSQRCCVLRLHHAIGDGISLMSLFLASCKMVDDPLLPVTIPSGNTSNRSRATSFVGRIKKWTVVLCLTLVYVVEMVLRSLWVKDTKTPISGGAGVEMWPRKVATARFCLQDMKAVKKAVNGTINDVLFGIISSGLARYLKLRSYNESKGMLRITGLAMVNTRQLPGMQDPSHMMKKGSKSRWGNQMGYFMLPIYIQNDVKDPLEYLRKAKAMMDRKKHSLEAHFSYKLGALIMSLLGPKIATLLNYRIIANTSFTISNVVGPQEEIMFAGNPVTYLRTTSTSIPHAITMHMVSYRGKADLQILVAKDIIPDPHVLAKCFQDALHEMTDVVANMVQEGCAS